MTDATQPTDPRPASPVGVEALLPCPFCGGKAEKIDLDGGDNAGGSCIACTVCQASGNVEFGFKENYVSNWNRRAALSAPSVTREAVAWRWNYVEFDGSKTKHLTRYDPRESTAHDRSWVVDVEALGVIAAPVSAHEGGEAAPDAGKGWLAQRLDSAKVRMTAHELVHDVAEALRAGVPLQRIKDALAALSPTALEERCARMEALRSDENTDARFYRKGYGDGFVDGWTQGLQMDPPDPVGEAGIIQNIDTVAVTEGFENARQAIGATS